MRRILLCFISFLLAISTVPAFAADQKSAIGTVRDFYKQYLNSSSEGRSSIALPKSKSFALEIAKNEDLCAKYGDGPCGWGADFDVYLCAQDVDPALNYANSGIWSREISKNTVEVRLNAYPSAKDAGNIYKCKIIYHMVLEDDAYVVDDIVYPDSEGSGSAREYLTKEREELLANSQKK